MVEKFPIFYTEKQTNDVTEHIKTVYGLDKNEEGYVAHEITSQYVHSDVLIQKNDDGEILFASFGMGARQMNSPLKNYKNAELVLHASPDVETHSKEYVVLANTVASMTKYPFLNDTWFGPGHTVDAHSKYKEEYGYDCFALLEMVEPADVTDIGAVHFLTMIPIYADEREWIMENGTFEYIELLFEEFGEDALYADKPREHFIPDEEQTDAIFMQKTMAALGIDEETFYELNSYLIETEDRGEEVTYDMIGEWLAEHSGE